jgi:hypothetical protein
MSRDEQQRWLAFAGLTVVLAIAVAVLIAVV